MSFGMSGGLLAMMGLSTAGNLAGSFLASNASNNASQITQQLGQQALGFQNQMWQQQQANAYPWLHTGAGALNNLAYLMGTGPNPQQQGGGAHPTGPGGPVAPPSRTGGPGQPGPRMMNQDSLSGVGNPPPGFYGSYSPYNIGDNPNGAGYGMPGNPYVSGGPGGFTGSPFNGWGGLNPIGQGGYPVGPGGTTLPGQPQQNGVDPAAGGDPTGGTTPGTQATAGDPMAGPGSRTGQLTGMGSGSTIDPNAGNSINTGLGGYGSLMQGYGNQFQGTPWQISQFQAPTDVTMQNDPGYQFRLQQGMQALQNGQAAAGTILGGGAMKAQQRYAQDYASNEYQNVYNRALSGYQANLSGQGQQFGQAQNQYQTNYNVWANDQANKYNRLAALAGVGQTAGQQLSGAGSNAASNTANILAANASALGGYAQNQGNIWGNFASSLGGMPLSLYALQHPYGI